MGLNTRYLVMDMRVHEYQGKSSLKLKLAEETGSGWSYLDVMCEASPGVLIPEAFAVYECDSETVTGVGERGKYTRMIVTRAVLKSRFVEEPVPIKSARIELPEVPKAGK